MAAIFILSGCAKPECEKTSDCISKTCTSTLCQSNKCVSTPVTNCCGNGAKEATEDGKPGDKCTCPQDYGKCEGKGKIKYGLREEDAKYVHYFCDTSRKCVLGVETPDIAPQNFLDSINNGYFKASAITKYNKPFDINKDQFEIKLTLDDANKDLVFPIKLTNVKMLLSASSSNSELLVSEKNLDVSLGSIGDIALIQVPLNLDYRPQEIEESGSIRYSIDYTFTRQVPSGTSSDGKTLYKNEIAREKHSAPNKQVFFVRTG